MTARRFRAFWTVRNWPEGDVASEVASKVSDGWEADLIGATLDVGQTGR